MFFYLKETYWGQISIKIMGASETLHSIMPIYFFTFDQLYLLYTGHNSMIYFVDDVGPSPLAQNVVFRDLPLRDVGQHPFFLTIFSFSWSSLLTIY